VCGLLTGGLTFGEDEGSTPLVAWIFKGLLVAQ